MAPLTLDGRTDFLSAAVGAGPALAVEMQNARLGSSPSHLTVERIAKAFSTENVEELAA